jgi:hypothetical protein
LFRYSLLEVLEELTYKKMPCFIPSLEDRRTVGVRSNNALAGERGGISVAFEFVVLIETCFYDPFLHCIVDNAQAIELIFIFEAKGYHFICILPQYYGIYVRILI